MLIVQYCFLGIAMFCCFNIILCETLKYNPKVF